MVTVNPLKTALKRVLVMSLVETLDGYLKTPLKLILGLHLGKGNWVLCLMLVRELSIDYHIIAIFKVSKTL